MTQGEETFPLVGAFGSIFPMARDPESSEASSGADAGRSAFGETSRTLIFRAAAGDVSALDDFCARYYGPLLAWLRWKCLHGGRSEASPEDYVQGFFEHVFARGLLGKYAPKWKESPALVVSDLLDPAKLASQLLHPGTPAVRAVADRLSIWSRKALSVWLADGVAGDELRAALCSDLGGMIYGPVLYSPDVFGGLRLRGETRKLLATVPAGCLSSGCLTICAADLIDPEGLATALQTPASRILGYLRRRLGEATVHALDCWAAPSALPGEVSAALCAELTAIIGGEALTADAPLCDTFLMDATRELLRRRPSGLDLAFLNRLLLEDALAPWVGANATARTNRLLLEDAFPVVLARPSPLLFRSFLLACLKNWWWSQLRRPGLPLVDLARSDSESEDPVEHASENPAPDKEYDRAWALGVIGRVEQRLANESRKSGRATHFELLMPYLKGDGSTEGQKLIGQRLGMSHSAVRVLVHRLRVRYRELSLEELAVELPPAAPPEAQARALAFLAEAAGS